MCPVQPHLGARRPTRVTHEEAIFLTPVLAVSFVRCVKVGSLGSNMRFWCTETPLDFRRCGVYGHARTQWTRVVDN